MIVSATPQRVYRALTKRVKKWLAPTSNEIESVGDILTLYFDPTYWTLRVNKLIPNRLVELQCIEANHIRPGLPASIREEWLGTKLTWRIAPHPTGAKISFVHSGLIPSLDCYKICEAGWDFYFQISLRNYLEGGIGQPGIYELSIQ